MVVTTEEAQTKLLAIFNTTKSAVSEAVESVRTEVDEIEASHEGDSSQASESADEDAADLLSRISRCLPDGSYFTVDASPCIHTEGGLACPDGTCAYGSVVGALRGEVWWDKLCGGDWECLKPEATGSESFARFLYHAIHGEELAEEPEPDETYILTDLSSVADMTDSLRPGDLIRFRGEQEHWAVFLEASGVNIYLYEANLDGCEGISYRRAEALESLVSRFSGYTAEIYR